MDAHYIAVLRSGRADAIVDTRRRRLFDAISWRAPPRFAGVNLVQPVVAAMIGLVAWQSQPAAQATFTSEQAAAGRTVHAERCAQCHRRQLRGGEAPDLAGPGMGVFRSMLAVMSRDIPHPEGGNALYVFELPGAP
jgi:hypothetical protein